MKLIKQRSHYYANSRLASWIYKKLNCDKPKCATSQGWTDWEKLVKDNHPIIHWMIDVGFDTIQDIMYFPMDVYNTIRIYIKNRFIIKTHVCNTTLLRGEYHEISERLLYGMFQLLVDYVEINLAKEMILTDNTITIPWIYKFKWNDYRSKELGLKHIEWQQSLQDDNILGHSQSCDATEVLRLYTWWTEVRPKRIDPYEQLDEYNNETTRSSMDNIYKIEDEYWNEDTDMLISLVHLRGKLWT